VSSKPSWSLTLCSVVLTALGAAATAHAQATKRTDLANYTFDRLTDNAVGDSLPRVSSNGLVVWEGSHALPGSTSSAADSEIMLWDGVSLFQLTDNAIDDARPTVNSAGTVAWQAPDNDADVEILVRVAGQALQLTSDGLPGVRDRYPDLNDAGILVWAREIGGYQIVRYDTSTGTPAVAIGPGYRPHINAAGHIHAAGEPAIVDENYAVVAQIGASVGYGYREFRRSEINDLDQLAIEAERIGPANSDFVGPRDILFWQAPSMRRLFRSPGPWHGRADLNDAGIVVWEGFGGLPGSTSPGTDREIYVYDPSVRQVVQITDDRDNDVWPTIGEDGRIYWFAGGSYPGMTSSPWDTEIFTAIGSNDADGDGVTNAFDNCALRANVNQADGGGVGSGTSDGIGRACQCGDANDDARVDADDVQAMRAWLADPVDAPLVAPAKCRVNERYAACSVLDATVLARALATPSPLAPGVAQTCDASLQTF
jgi:hypothetical protein